MHTLFYIFLKIYVFFKFKKVTISYKTRFSKKTVFEGQNYIGIETYIDGYIGYGTYVGNESVIRAITGKYCSIGHKVNILTGTHPSHTFVSTSPVFYSIHKQNGTTYTETQRFEEIVYADELNKFGVIIGNDVWVGFGVSIIGGVCIGDGAIIASNSLVTKDVMPYTIVGGIPAKEIGKRFDDEKIEWLLNFKWWNKSENWIKQNSDYFLDIDKFILKETKK